MLHHKTALRLAAPVAVLALSLTACGGGDDKADADAKSTATPAAKASKSEAASGGEMATGESATGKVKEEEGVVTYDVLATKVDIGTEAEAAKLVQDKKDAKGKVLAIAHVKFTHKSGPAITSSSDANDNATVWADGQRGAILIGSSTEGVPGCEDNYDVESWKTGESHTFCEAYLIPASAKNAEIHWSEEDGEPYIWKFANTAAE